MKRLRDLDDSPEKLGIRRQCWKSEYLEQPLLGCPPPPVITRANNSDTGQVTRCVFGIKLVYKVWIPVDRG